MASRRAGQTKTQQLRQAKSAALVRQYEQKEEAARKQQQMADTVKRKRIVTEPRKVDFSKPGMTKTMLARLKLAEKFKQEYERKREETIVPGRRPRRTPAPIGGDARMGREKLPKRPTSSMAPPISTPIIPPSSIHDSQAGPSRTMYSRRGGPIPKSVRRLEHVPERTNELARTMNADLVQAEPIGQGPIDSIVIPPGTVNENHTTVISIQQPPLSPGRGEMASSQIANRSIRVISETLDEQDATEATAVQNKLSELQQARREFVIAVANVGGNAVNIGDEPAQSYSRTVPRSHGMQQPLRQTPQRYLYKIPDLEDDMLRVRYGRDHPDVLAAREFMQRRKEEMNERDASIRMEEEFQRQAMQPDDDLQLDVPFDQEILYDGDISWEFDEETGMELPMPSRIKASRPPIPIRQEAYSYEPFDPDELERFFDVQGYPPCLTHGPPPGRENLPPDLWDLDDPWFQPPPEPDIPDLINFDD